METKKALIMQVERSFTTAYTTDGQFIKLPRKSSHKVGDVVNINDFRCFRNKTFSLKLTATAAVALLFIILGIFNPFFLQHAEAEAKTYLSLGLNTGSIEVWADYEGKVIKTSYTAGSQLTKLDIEGKDIYEAITIMMIAARKSGFLNEGLDDILLVDIVNLNTDTSNQVQESKLMDFISAGLNGQDYHGMMVISHHNKEYLDKAQELGLTVSQYHIYEKSSVEGYSLSNEQIKHGHIRKMLAQVGTSPEKLFNIKHRQYDEMQQGNEMHKDSTTGQDSINNNELKMDHNMQYNGGTKPDRDSKTSSEATEKHSNSAKDHPDSMKMPTDMDQHNMQRPPH